MYLTLLQQQKIKHINKTLKMFLKYTGNMNTEIYLL